ncbi:MAG TPA: hypothetical protein VK473_16410 [Terriglobales bacterium]|nr:hypothetical protein [Terriglobales bacterium]
MAGAALSGFGIIILYENLAGAARWLSHMLGANGSEALGVFPSVILTVWQVLPLDAAGPQHAVQGLLQHMLLLSWPLLLVIAGTVLWQES